MSSAPSCDVRRVGDSVFLIAEGDFLDEIAIPAALRFAELIAADETPITFIALIKHLGRYESSGRKAWQHELTMARRRLD